MEFNWQDTKEIDNSSCLLRIKLRRRYKNGRQSCLLLSTCFVFLFLYHTHICYAPSPYLQTNRKSEQVHHGNAKARREFFISSALGLKPHLTQRNQTRAPNEAVWRFIYSQLFVSVTGYLAIPDWTGRMSSCNAFLMLSHIEIFPYLVKECSSRKQET